MHTSYTQLFIYIPFNLFEYGFIHSWLRHQKYNLHKNRNDRGGKGADLKVLFSMLTYKKYLTFVRS